LRQAEKSIVDRPAATIGVPHNQASQVPAARLGAPRERDDGQARSYFVLFRIHALSHRETLRQLPHAGSANG
jgi:hypothetical protein